MRPNAHLVKNTVVYLHPRGVQQGFHTTADREKLLVGTSARYPATPGWTTQKGPWDQELEHGR
jgi:hypothetical protein